VVDLDAIAEQRLLVFRDAQVRTTDFVEIRMLLQRTADPKNKERMHLDLESDDVEAEACGLEAPWRQPLRPAARTRP
jgi:hypothetical protein